LKTLKSNAGSVDAGANNTSEDREDAVVGNGKTKGSGKAKGKGKRKAADVDAGEVEQDFVPTNAKKCRKSKRVRGEPVVEAEDGTWTALSTGKADLRRELTYMASDTSALQQADDAEQDDQKIEEDSGELTGMRTHISLPENTHCLLKRSLPGLPHEQADNDNGGTDHSENADLASFAEELQGSDETHEQHGLVTDEAAEKDDETVIIPFTFVRPSHNPAARPEGFSSPSATTDETNHSLEPSEHANEDLAGGKVPLSSFFEIR
jgi:hypothetical protein